MHYLKKRFHLYYFVLFFEGFISSTLKFPNSLLASNYNILVFGLSLFYRKKIAFFSSYLRGGSVFKWLVRFFAETASLNVRLLVHVFRSSLDLELEFTVISVNFSIHYLQVIDNLLVPDCPYFIRIILHFVIFEGVV